MIDINNPISGTQNNVIRKRDVKLHLKLSDVNLEKPTRFILKAVPLSNENSSSDLQSPKQLIELNASGKIKDKNLHFDTCSQNSLSS